jgi:hypothetical protein
MSSAPADNTRVALKRSDDELKLLDQYLGGEATASSPDTETTTEDDIDYTPVLNALQKTDNALSKANESYEGAKITELYEMFKSLPPEGQTDEAFTEMMTDRPRKRAMFYNKARPTGEWAPQEGIGDIRYGYGAASIGWPENLLKNAIKALRIPRQKDAEAGYKTYRLSQDLDAKGNKRGLTEAVLREAMGKPQKKIEGAPPVAPQPNAKPEESYYALNTPNAKTPRYFATKEDALAAARRANIPTAQITKGRVNDLLNETNIEAARIATTPVPNKRFYPTWREESRAIQEIQPWEDRSYANPDLLAWDFRDYYGPITAEDGVEWAAAICEVNGKYYAQEPQDGDADAAQVEMCRAGNYVGSVHTHLASSKAKDRSKASPWDMNSGNLRKGTVYLAPYGGGLQKYEAPAQKWPGKRVKSIKLIPGNDSNRPELFPEFELEKDYEQWLERQGWGQSLIRKPSDGPTKLWLSTDEQEER